MKYLRDAKRIVIKIGSALLVDEDNRLREAWLDSVAEDVATLMQDNVRVVVVTSGAIGLGRETLGYGDRVLELEEKQAAASCGQIRLISAWANALAAHGLFPAQMLLTADDSIQRRRYLNARNTLEALFDHPKAVPVINENDTVATAEIRFGDNDRLAARVAQMAAADGLILLSDIDGLYTTDPTQDDKAEFIAEVSEVTAEIEVMASDAVSYKGSGGMVTKLAAAKIAMAAGCHMCITRGDVMNPVRALLDNAKHTIFIASQTPMSARKRWIAGDMHPVGSVVIDVGAAKALTQGNSLLSAGVTALEGDFDRGDTVLIKNTDGKPLGRGIIAYDSGETSQILGKKTSEIEKILGFNRKSALIHRDDLVLGE